MLRNKILEAPSVAGIRIIVKIHPLVDLLVDCVPYRSLKLRFGQQFARFNLTLEKKLVAGYRDPVDVAKPPPDAHTDAVFRVLELSRCRVTPS